MPTSHASSRVRVRVRQAVRGCVLDGNADAAAGGVFYDLFGLVVEAVALQAAMGRSQGGEVGIYGSTPDPPARQEDAAHDRGQHRVDANAKGVQEVGRKEKGPRHEMCSRVDASKNMYGREEVFENVSTGADTKANVLGRRRT